MATRRSRALLLGFLWIAAFALLALVIVLYDDTALSRGSGFPHMPLYGAVTWWFFFMIPLIGSTWGFFNDWKGD